MIDFRYLLTTIVAVFLALAIGLLIGSGLLADELADDLERQVQEVIDRNNELRTQINEQQGRIDAADEFALQLEPSLIEGELSRDSIVLFRFEGTDGALLDRVREAVQLADGSIATTVTISDRMSMEDASAAAELRADLPRALEGEGNLARLIGRELGTRAAGDAAGFAGDPLFGEIDAALVEHGFIDIETDRDFAIPLSAGFVVAAGAEGDAPFDLQVFSQALLGGLASEDGEVVAVEGWTSDWDFVPTLRDSDIREVVATVDHGDTVAGSVSMVFELSRAAGDEPGHYGFRDGSDGIAPESPQED